MEVVKIKYVYSFLQTLSDSLSLSVVADHENILKDSLHFSPCVSLQFPSTPIYFSYSHVFPLINLYYTLKKQY